MRKSVAVVFAILAVAAASGAQDLRTDERPEQEPPFVGGVPGPVGGLFTEPELLTRAIDKGFERFGETGTPGNGYYTELWKRSTDLPEA